MKLLAIVGSVYFPVLVACAFVDGGFKPAATAVVAGTHFDKKNDRAGGRGTFSIKVETSSTRELTGCTLKVEFFDASGMQLDYTFIGGAFEHTIPVGKGIFTDVILNKKKVEVDMIDKATAKILNCI